MHIRASLQAYDHFALDAAISAGPCRPSLKSPREGDQDTRAPSPRHGAQSFISLVITLIFIGLSGFAGAAEQNASPGASRETSLILQEAPKIPPLLRPVQRESERDKLKRMSAFIGENRPKPTTPMNPGREIQFCDRFVDDFVSLRGIKAIEPRFTAQSEGEVTAKLKLRRCEKLKREDTTPPGTSPDPFGRGLSGPSLLGDIGGPPYRFYELRLDPKRRTRYPVLYHENTLTHKGFARLDLDTCKVEDDKEGYSEKERLDPGLSRIGLNTLITYKNEVFALILDFHTYPTNATYRLKLYRLTVPPAEGDDCYWWHHSENRKAR